MDLRSWSYALESDLKPHREGPDLSILDKVAISKMKRLRNPVGDYDSDSATRQQLRTPGSKWKISALELHVPGRLLKEVEI